VQRLTAADPDCEHRQLGVVDAAGRGATYTGGECNDWAGGRIGAGYAAQGNILVSHATVDALADTFEGLAGCRLAVRLLDCLDAAQTAGGTGAAVSRRACSWSSRTAATAASSTL